MSDVKPRRVPRESVRQEIASVEPIGTDAAAPVVAGAPAALDAMSSPPEPVIAPAGLIAIEPLEARAAAADPVWGAIADAHAALAHGFEAMALECTGWTKSGVTAATDAALAILGAKSFAEIVEINAALTRRGIDAVIESSARLSEISLKAATEASRPMLARFVGT